MKSLSLRDVVHESFLSTSAQQAEFASALRADTPCLLLVEVIGPSREK
jgi:hypothetical protein